MHSRRAKYNTSSLVAGSMSSLTTNSKTEDGEVSSSSSPKPCGVASSSHAVTAPVALIPELWSKLPTHLIDLVVSKLAFSTMISSRLVCKSWDQMVTSPGFCPPNPAPKCVLLGHNSTENSLTVHNPSTKLWNTWPYNPLAESIENRPESERAAYLEYLCDGVLPYGLDMVGTAGGLLCFRCSGIFHYDPNHMVTNPVLKSFRVLPKMVSSSKVLMNLPTGTGIWWAPAAMLFDQATGGYMLVTAAVSFKINIDPSDGLAGRFTYLRATQVYDSLTNSWSLTYQLRELWEIAGGWIWFLGCYNKSALYKGFLFVISGPDIWNRGLSLMIFSMEEGVWVKQFVAIVRDETEGLVVDGSITVSNNELYMVSTTTASCCSTFMYWKLRVADLPTAWRNGSLEQEPRSVWQLVSRSITTLSPQLRLWDGTEFWFSRGRDGFFYFVFGIHDKDAGDQHAAVTVYDISAHTWTTWRFEGPDGIEDGASFAKVCIFQPSFAQV